MFWPILGHASLSAPLRAAEKGGPAKIGGDARRWHLASSHRAAGFLALAHLDEDKPVSAVASVVKLTPLRPCGRSAGGMWRLVWSRHFTTNIHCRKSLTEAFGTEFGPKSWDHFTVHFTPVHGSWLNQAEIEIGLFSRQCLGKRRIANLKTLRRQAGAWNRRINRAGTQINWQFDRQQVRRKFGYKNNSFKRSET
jgi:hypothetical protein